MSAYVVNPYVYAALPLSALFVGVESGSAANNYSVQNWSNASIPKVYSVGGSQRYGTAGYYQIRPLTPWDAGYSLQFGEAVGGSNDLGINASTHPTRYSHPVFASVSGSAGSFVNYGPYAIFRGPNGSDLVRLGGLSVATTAGVGNLLSGAYDGAYGEPFTITLNQSVRFRLGIVVDHIDFAQYAPLMVSIANASFGQVDSLNAVGDQVVYNDRVTDMVFFDISGNYGDVFTIRLWQIEAQATVTATGLLTFDLL